MSLMITRRRYAYIVVAFLLVFAVHLPVAHGQSADVSPQTIAIYRPASNNFYLSSDITVGDITAIVTLAKLGMKFNDLPITGDWNDDGIDTYGFYSATTATFVLTDSNIDPKVDYTFALGQPGDLPIAGDWDGDGKDGIGLFRPSSGIFFLKNEVGAGFADFETVMGSDGDVALAGDWNGDGTDSPGVYRPSEGTFILSDQVCSCTASLDHTSTFGTADDLPFSGDWDGDGSDGIGVYNASSGVVTLRNDPASNDATNDAIVQAVTGGIPLAGRWGTSSNPSALATATPTK